MPNSVTILRAICGGPLEVAGAAVGDFAVDDLLGDRAAEQAADGVLEPALGVQEPVVLGPVHRVAERAVAPAEDRDLVHGSVCGRLRATRAWPASW